MITSGQVVHEREHDESIEQIIVVGEHWFRRVLIKGRMDRKVRECTSIGIEEARRILLSWGFSPEVVWETTKPSSALSTGSMDA